MYTKSAINEEEKNKSNERVKTRNQLYMKLSEVESGEISYMSRHKIERLDKNTQKQNKKQHKFLQVLVANLEQKLGIKSVEKFFNLVN